MTDSEVYTARIKRTLEILKRFEIPVKEHSFSLYENLYEIHNEYLDCVTNRLNSVSVGDLERLSEVPLEELVLSDSIILRPFIKWRLEKGV